MNSVVARALALGASMHVEPLEATGGVRIAFFYDPDFLVVEVVEVVERHLHHDLALDANAVGRERALPTPERPRLSHVAITVVDPDGLVIAGR